VSYRRLVQLALFVAIPNIAGAQFTTFIPPRAQTSDSAKAVVAAVQKAKTDSTVQAQLANMKTWVDSAAGLPAAPTASQDSLARPGARTDSVSGEVVSTVRRDSALVASGRTAPETASALPLLAVTGAGLLLIGGVLLGTVRPSRNRA
jgi:hypothetical protein